MKRFLVVAAVPLLWLIGCRAAPPQTIAVRTDAPQAAFWARLQQLCGRAFAGRLTEGSAADSSFRTAALVMHVRSCSDNEIRIPFHADTNRSRTWVITRTAGGLRLKHDHRHHDGTEDAITQYGGDTRTVGTAERQEFYADSLTAALIPAARTNVWTMEISGTGFAYALRREGTDRRFRVEFDLTKPIAAPPPPWGASHDVDGSGSSALEITRDTSNLLASIRVSATTFLSDSAGPRLIAKAVVTNLTDAPLELRFGDCALNLRAYLRTDRSGPVAWDSDFRQPWNTGAIHGCLMYLAVHRLPARGELAAREFTLSVPLVDILADSLADAPYYLGVRLALNGQMTPEVSAGQAILQLPRPPLRQSRNFENFTYTAEPVSVTGSPAVIRSSVTATLTNAGAAMTSFLRDCAVTLIAYRTGSRRDEAPRSGSPDWMQQQTCTNTTDKASMRRNESRTFETTATAREVRGDSLPPGRYYFAVIYNTGRQRIYLSAGNAVLQ